MQVDDQADGGEPLFLMPHVDFREMVVVESLELLHKESLVLKAEALEDRKLSQLQ
jgi:hypothetical protein